MPPPQHRSQGRADRKEAPALERAKQQFGAQPTPHLAPTQAPRTRHPQCTPTLPTLVARYPFRGEGLESRAAAKDYDPRDPALFCPALPCPTLTYKPNPTLLQG